ncbi:MAG: adenylyltransferase/cytidyltransferase family protein [archaeon]|nr:adenylyltransferase/cytidyltransferase family protein [archaeon]
MAERFKEELKLLYPNKLEDDFDVVIAGTFDIIHPGHIYFIREAAKIGKVHVIIARDASVEKYKGQPPILPEKQRLKNILGIKGVKTAELGSDNGKLVPIVRRNPDLFLLGPNQYGDPDKYEDELKKVGCTTIFRKLPELDESFPLNSSRKIKEKILKTYKMDL